MRLLLTADTLGGVWTFACELARELLLRGHQIMLVSFGRAPSASQLEDVSRLEDRTGFQYVASEIWLEWQSANQTAFTAGTPLLLELCEQFRPDALLLSQFCYGALPVNIPKFLTAHSDVFSWANAVGKAPLPEDDWLQTYRSLVQAGLDGADLIIAPTAVMLASLRAEFRVQSPTMVISNGRTLPLPADLHERTMRAVTAGRMWDPAKNLALLEAAELPLPVLVAGEKEHDTTGKLMFTLVGQLEGDALLRVFRESEIYICCSHYEPFGLAPLEAALCGCAVVANDIPSLREVWSDGALYFHDAVTLSSLLHSLVACPALLKDAQLRSASRAKRYTAGAMAEGYLQAVSALVSRRIEAAHAA